MDRELIVEHLALAELHVEKGKDIIDRQSNLITRLSANGHDTDVAEALLAQFMDTQSAHVADRDRLQRELAQRDEQRGKKASERRAFPRLQEDRPPPVLSTIKCRALQ